MTLIFVFLLGRQETAAQRVACIRYVGRTINSSVWGDGDTYPSHSIEEAPIAHDRLDLLLRISKLQSAEHLDTANTTAGEIDEPSADEDPSCHTDEHFE